MATIGILLCIHPGEEEDSRPVIEVQADNVSPDEAIELVRIDERRNVGHDLAHADDAEDRAHFEAMVPLVEAMAWAPSTSHPGQSFVDSVWGGGLADDGLQWRFVPVMEDE